MGNCLINYQYKGSQRLDKMPIYVRAAQFSPFAALTGYDELIEETSRLTDERGEVSEEMAEHINEVLGLICESYPQRLRVKIKYFVPDRKKPGGSYQIIDGAVRQIDMGAMKIVFDNNKSVSIGDIFDIELTR